MDKPDQNLPEDLARKYLPEPITRIRKAEADFQKQAEEAELS